LLDLAGDLLGGLAECLTLELGDAQLEGLDMLLKDPDCGGQGAVLGLQLGHQCLQNGRIIRQ
jgi:hypothetical protein